MNHGSLSVSLIFACLFVPSVSLPRPCDPRGCCPSFFSLASCLSSSSVGASFSLSCCCFMIGFWPNRPIALSSLNFILVPCADGPLADDACLFLLHCFALCSESGAFLSFCNITLFFTLFERNFQKMFPYGSPPSYGLI